MTARCLHATHDAKRLYDDLLRRNNYNKLIRPGPGPDFLNQDQLQQNYTLTVKMGLKLAQIIDVVSIINYTLQAVSVNSEFIVRYAE